MAEPARQPPAANESPPVDPRAIDRAYHAHRARRRARLERTKSLRRAGVRFWAFLAVLVGLTIFLGLTVWHEIQRLFGL
jgi:hypothetical protein